MGRPEQWTFMWLSNREKETIDKGLQKYAFLNEFQSKCLAVCGETLWGQTLKNYNILFQEYAHTHTHIHAQQQQNKHEN